MATQVRLPAAIPATSSTAAAAVWPAPIVSAAAKIAAHDAIVAGLDAVPASAIVNARPGVATSAGVSPPWRTRIAVHSVRAPRATSTAAPASASAMRTGSMASSGAAPATPQAA